MEGLETSTTFLFKFVKIWSSDGNDGFATFNPDFDEDGGEGPLDNFSFLGVDTFFFFKDTASLFRSPRIDFLVGDVLLDDDDDFGDVFFTFDEQALEDFFFVVKFDFFLLCKTVEDGLINSDSPKMGLGAVLLAGIDDFLLLCTDEDLFFLATLVTGNEGGELLVLLLLMDDGDAALRFLRK